MYTEARRECVNGQPSGDHLFAEKTPYAIGRWMADVGAGCH